VERLDDSIAAVVETNPEPRRFNRRAAGPFHVPVEPPFEWGFVRVDVRCPAAYAGAGNWAAQRMPMRDLSSGSIAQGK